MRHKKIAVFAAAAVAALGAGGGAIAVAGSGTTDRADGGNEAPDQKITGAALQQASDAALKHTGGGRVSDTEAGDEESAYQVEVTKDDGTQVDVQLDAQFKVVGSKTEQADH